ncbi:MAG: hypothetical protein ACE5J4_02155 [Candidatus Aenigmatarchaeota archaeon]
MGFIICRTKFFSDKFIKKLKKIFNTNILFVKLLVKNMVRRRRRTRRTTRRRTTRRRRRR